MHMSPSILHTRNDVNVEMVPGMTFTIEPILLLYPYKQLYAWEDNWTIVSPSNPSAQWEHIIHITEKGNEILTLRKNEIII